jgi:hypothetical protein
MFEQEAEGLIIIPFGLSIQGAASRLPGHCRKKDCPKIW